MKEKIKTILIIVVTITLSITGSVVANTLLQASSVSYKTSNGDVTDVNSALDRLFDVADINQQLDSFYRLLWINSNSANDFGNQTITLDEEAQNYSVFLVITKRTTSYNQYDTTIVFKDLQTFIHSDVYNISYRLVTITGNQATFSDENTVSTYSNGTTSTNNNKNIPYAIYGIK